MFHYTVELKQHTPLIHFQGEEEGAALRATEVKPRLDHFILHKLKSADPSIFAKYSDLITTENFEGKKKAQYKLIIICETPTQYEIKPIFSKNYTTTKGRELLAPAPYFSNNLGLMYKYIRFDFSSFNQRLLKLIEEVLPFFCVDTNFGGRQSKGFGSFTPKYIDEYDFKTILKKVNRTSVIRCQSKNRKLEDIFKEIDETYKVLKSGSSFGTIAESKLRLHFSRKNVFWEKDKFFTYLSDKDQKLFGRIKGSDKIEVKEEDSNFSYIRVLLGLAEQNEYLGLDKDEKVVLKITDTETISENDKKKVIQRFQSPIQFKVFESTIYIVTKEIHPKILDHEFEFTVYHKTKSGEETEKGSFTLRSPKNFKLTDFIKSEINLKKDKWLILQNQI